MIDTTNPDYLRGVDDALAEVQRRLDVLSKLGESLHWHGAYAIVRETSRRLHGLPEVA